VHHLDADEAEQMRIDLQRGEQQGAHRLGLDAVALLDPVAGAELLDIGDHHRLADGERRHHHRQLGARQVEVMGANRVDIGAGLLEDGLDLATVSAEVEQITAIGLDELADTRQGPLGARVAGLIGEADEAGGERQQLADHGLAFGQFDLGLLALGDVAADADDGDDLALLIAHGGVRPLQPTRAMDGQFALLQGAVVGRRMQ
jgi:hypothetical protein